MMARVGLLGAGHIARALAEGWSRPGVTPAPSLAFYDVLPERSVAIADACAGKSVRSVAELVKRSEIIVLAVRPPEVAEALAASAPYLGERCLVSVAAGVPLARLTAALPDDVAVARVMPNVAAALGQGVFLLVAGSLGVRRADVTTLFSLCGTVIEMGEDLFDAATAVSGCMPGILGHLVTAFAAAAEAEGIDGDAARVLAVEGVRGAAALIAREGDPAAVVAQAATPGGMTAAAVSALEERGIDVIVRDAIVAAARRAKELA